VRQMIELEGKHYNVTVYTDRDTRLVQIDSGVTAPADIVPCGPEGTRVSWGESSADMRVAVSGETVYVRAFGRTFTLRIIDPVEQAAEEAGDQDCRVRAPMPGMVVDVRAVGSDRVLKGQILMTIESMKILTQIIAPRNADISCIHFQQGQTFDRNAVLITLKEKEA
jgi:biotin carboxyl carrier protein